MKKEFLPEDKHKQDRIIEASFTAFSKNGYKKTSVNDIAEAAGIAKSIIFYYYGNKKSLYTYLCRQCASIILDELEKNSVKDITDFFDRLSAITELKISVIKKYPGLLGFIKSIYEEDDETVKNEIMINKTNSADFRFDYFFEDIDIYKFKDDIDPNLLIKIFKWTSNGFASEITSATDIKEINNFVEDFNNFITMLKKNIYKKEYL